jgi:hypothetical protein
MKEKEMKSQVFTHGRKPNDGNSNEISHSQKSHIFTRSSSSVSYLLRNKKNTNDVVSENDIAELDSETQTSKVTLDKSLISDYKSAVSIEYRIFRSQDKIFYELDKNRFKNQLETIINQDLDKNTKILLDQETHTIVRQVLKFLNKSSKQLVMYSDDTFFNSNGSYLTLHKSVGSNLSINHVHSDSHNENNIYCMAHKTNNLLLIRAAIMLSIRIILYRTYDKFMKYGEKNKCINEFNRWFNIYANNLTNALDPINELPMEEKNIRFTTYNANRPKGKKISVIQKTINMESFKKEIENTRHTYDKSNKSFSNTYFAFDMINLLIEELIKHSDMEEFMRIYMHLFSLISSLDRAIAIFISHGSNYVTDGIIIPH